MPDNHIPEHLKIGGLLFAGMDQTDFTGPFEVLSRVPNSTFYVIGKDKNPIRDTKGLILTPEFGITDAPALDVLLVPGGQGQEELMDDQVVLGFIREQAARAVYVLSVCTGALLCGAAGMLIGRHATTHWASFHLLKYFGAHPENRRVVVDGNLITTAGVTAGIDGALYLAMLLRGEKAAQTIQLTMQYAPEPPFNSGSPATASPEVVNTIQTSMKAITERRLATAKRLAARLGINPPD